VGRAESVMEPTALATGPASASGREQQPWHSRKAIRSGTGVFQWMSALRYCDVPAQRPARPSPHPANFVISFMLDKIVIAYILPQEVCGRTRCTQPASQMGGDRL